VVALAANLSASSPAALARPCARDHFERTASTAIPAVRAGSRHSSSRPGLELEWRGAARTARRLVKEKRTREVLVNHRPPLPRSLGRTPTSKMPAPMRQSSLFARRCLPRRPSRQIAGGQ